MIINLNLLGFTGTGIPPAQYTLTSLESVSSSGPGLASGTGLVSLDGVPHGSYSVSYSLDGNPGVIIDPIDQSITADVTLSGTNTTFIGNASVEVLKREAAQVALV